jgi:hypothetical protein
MTEVLTATEDMTVAEAVWCAFPAAPLAVIEQVKAACPQATLAEIAAAYAERVREAVQDRAEEYIGQAEFFAADQSPIQQMEAWEGAAEQMGLLRIWCLAGVFGRRLFFQQSVSN